jgi:hypothetical protein
MALRQNDSPRRQSPLDVPQVAEPRREHDAAARHRPGTPGYGSVLEAAYRLGRADGELAAAFEEEPPDLAGTTCRGRTAREFAEYLWADLPGPVPGGIEVNAPIWYLIGLNDALSDSDAPIA